MHAVRYFTLTMGAILAQLVPVWFAHAEERKVTSQGSFLKASGTNDGKAYGFCGMVMLEIDRQPAACFGLHQPLGGKPRYTYLILFKPDPKGEPGSGSGGRGESTIGSDGKVKVDLNMTAFAGGREIKVEYKLDADGEKISSESLKVEGQESGKDGPRVFLFDLANERAMCRPLKIALQAVPDFADQEAWGMQILAALKELKEKSEEAKTFFGDKK